MVNLSWGITLISDLFCTLHKENNEHVATIKEKF
jgi:hypothetical protein